MREPRRRSTSLFTASLASRLCTNANASVATVTRTTVPLIASPRHTCRQAAGDAAGLYRPIWPLEMPVGLAYNRGVPKGSRGGTGRPGGRTDGECGRSERPDIGTHRIGEADPASRAGLRQILQRAQRSGNDLLL